MKNFRHGCLLAATLLVAGNLFAADATPADRAAGAAASGRAHTREEETASIRKHHLLRLNDLLTTEPGELRQNCKYESEISTTPPGRRVVLTFDDGPEPGQTEYILEILKKYDIKGTFFLIGEKARAHPELVGKILDGGGHTVGNHSWSHPNFHAISAAQQAEEVLKYEEAPASGPVRLLFRYPYGNASCETNDLLHARGYRIVGWHVDSCDWAFDRTASVDAKEALSCGVLAQNRSNYVEHVVSTVRAHRGGIVLMHEIHPNTIRKLDEIIGRLKEDGFTFGSIEDADFVPSLR